MGVGERKNTHILPDVSVKLKRGLCSVITLQ